jgi:hypothetical protein
VRPRKGPQRNPYETRFTWPPQRGTRNVTKRTNATNARNERDPPLANARGGPRGVSPAYGPDAAPPPQPPNLYTSRQNNSCRRHAVKTKKRYQTVTRQIRRKPALTVRRQRPHVRKRPHRYAAKSFHGEKPKNGVAIKHRPVEGGRRARSRGGAAALPARRRRRETLRSWHFRSDLPASQTPVRTVAHARYAAHETTCNCRKALTDRRCDVALGGVCGVRSRRRSRRAPARRRACGWFVVDFRRGVVCCAV